MKISELRHLSLKFEDQEEPEDEVPPYRVEVLDHAKTKSTTRSTESYTDIPTLMHIGRVSSDITHENIDQYHRNTKNSTHFKDDSNEASEAKCSLPITEVDKGTQKFSCNDFLFERKSRTKCKIIRPSIQGQLPKDNSETDQEATVLLIFKASPDPSRTDPNSNRKHDDSIACYCCGDGGKNIMMHPTNRDIKMAMKPRGITSEPSERAQRRMANIITSQKWMTRPKQRMLICSQKWR